MDAIFAADAVVAATETLSAGDKNLGKVNNLECTKATMKKTFKERILGHVRPCYEYNKGSRFGADKNFTEDQKTGEALFINECPNLAVVDIDINKDLDPQTRANIKEELLEKLPDDNLIVESASGGLHIYCNLLFEPEQGRNTKIYKDPDGNYDIDIFGKVCKENNQVVLPNSTVDYKGEHGLGKGVYKWVCGNDDTVIKYQLGHVLQQLKLPNIEIVAKLRGKKHDEKPAKKTAKVTVKDDDSESDEVTPEDVGEEKPSKQLFDVLVKGFDENVEIHNCTTNAADEEVAIPMLYATLLWCESDEISTDDIDEALDYIYDNATLTENCRREWGKRTRDAARAYDKGDIKIHNIGYIINSLKYHNPEYFKNQVLPLLKKQNTTVDASEFLTARYSLSDYKAEYGNFKNESEYINNLIKCLAFIDDGRYIYY